ncbi:Uncharacterised protein [Legionella waltersii]|nr:Uncharacterised protein [Legionella waltersii]
MFEEEGENVIRSLTAEVSTHFIVPRLISSLMVSKRRSGASPNSAALSSVIRESG